jgi:hypothetical protein
LCPFPHLFYFHAAPFFFEFIIFIMSAPQSPLSLIAGTAHYCTFSELAIHPLLFQEVFAVVPFVESRERTRERDTHT